MISTSGSESPLHNSEKNTKQNKKENLKKKVFKWNKGVRVYKH